MVASRVEFSFRDAINPAYNSNVDSCFPQPLLPPVTSSVETSLALEGSNINATNPSHKDVLLEKKSAETLRCDICSINCNSKEMLDNHLSGKKHRKKTKAQNTDTSLLDQVKTEHIEGAETKSVKNLDNGALPGLKKTCTASGFSCGTQALFHQHVSLKKHALVVDCKEPDTMMLEPSTICAPEVSEMHKPKHQECSESVAGNTCNRTDVHDEIMTDKGLQPQSKADYSAEPMLHALNGKLAEGTLNLVEVCASRASVQVCTVCNIFNYSQASLQKHLAGKTHARNVKKFSTVTSLVDNGTQALFHRHVSLKKHALVVDGEGVDTMMLEPSTICAPEVSKMHKPKHQECSESVADNTCNRTYVHDEIMTYKGLQPQLKADYSVEPMLHASNGKLAESKLNLVEVCASRALVLVCTVCNIVNYSQASLQTHLAGKIHAQNVNFFSTMTSSPVRVHPIEILGSNNLKPAREPRSLADPSSVVPVGSMEIEEPILSEGGTAMLSPNVCTMCNLKCNSQELFRRHLAGKKHASKVRKLGSDTQTPNLHMKGDGASRNFPLVQFHGHDPTVTSHDVEKFNDASSINPMVPRDNNPKEKSADCMVSDAALSTIPVTRPKDDSSSNGTDGATLQGYESEANQRASKRGKGVQFAYCDVCEVYCNCSEILNTHKMGKRHLKQFYEAREVRERRDFSKNSCLNGLPRWPQK